LIMVERRAAVPIATTAPPAGSAAPADGPTPAAQSAADGFELRQAEGYFFALIAALSYGSSPVLIRAALEDASGLSILGGLVSYVAAAALLLASLILPSRRGLIAAINPSTTKVFFLAGF